MAGIKCPTCNSPSILRANGCVAPFVVEIAEYSRTLDWSTSLRECTSCGLVFFEKRYSPEVMKYLYGGYRAHSYFQVRRKWEPWYRVSLNSALEPGSEMVTDRVAFMEEIIGRKKDPATLRGIVDFGGDAGQFFPRRFNGHKYLVDISEKPLEPGVVRVQSIVEIAVEDLDLLVVAHVLEHLPDPFSELNGICAHLRSDTLVYLEVPMDLPGTKSVHRSHAYQWYLTGLRKVKWLFIAMDFFGGVLRNIRGRVPMLGVVKQSEHINYFSVESLSELANRCGLTVLEVSEDPLCRINGIRLGRLGMLCRADLDKPQHN